MKRIIGYIRNIAVSEGYVCTVCNCDMGVCIALACEYVVVLCLKCTCQSGNVNKPSDSYLDLALCCSAVGSCGGDDRLADRIVVGLCLYSAVRRYCRNAFITAAPCDAAVGTKRTEYGCEPGTFTLVQKQ